MSPFWRGFLDGATGGPLRRWLGSLTLFGVLNFLVLQWFGVRIAASFEPRSIPGWQHERINDEQIAALGGRWWSRYAPPRGTPIRWMWLRWIWPLTGWWSPYRWIAHPGTRRLGRWFGRRR